MLPRHACYLVGRLPIRWLLVLAMLMHSPGLLQAQQLSTTIALPAVQYALDRLAPGITSGEAVFFVDASTTMQVDVTATFGGLSISIEAPNGQVIDSNTIDGLGGTFAHVEGTSEANLDLILTANTPGFHTVYRFPSLGAGNYAVRFVAPADLAEEVAIVTQVLTDSAVGANLLASRTPLPLGERAVLTAAVFDGATPIAEATIVVEVQSPTGTPITLTLLDDGGPADDVAGDSLYSALFLPSDAGTYEAVATINGFTASGAPFVRQAATQFTVIVPSSRLTGTVIDQGIDDDNDGLLDRVVVEVEIDATQAGDHTLFVHLRAANGRRVVRSVGVQDLPAGLHTIGVDFDAAALYAFQENGPYTIELVEVLFLSGEGDVPVVRLLNVGQTQAYQLSQLRTPALVLTGNTVDTGIDTDNNGKFDALRIDMEVAVREAGAYQWSAKLIDTNINGIGFASNTGALGAGVHTISLSFNGQRIGENGVNGPYTATSFVIFGAGEALLASEVAKTQAFNVTDFEGAVVNLPPVAQCQAVTVPTSLGACTAEASVDNGSFDPDGDPIILEHAPSGPYGVGVIDVTLTVTDDQGASVTCLATVTVVDQESPTVTASLEPLGAGDESGDSDEGRFRIAFAAHDNCDSAPSVQAVLVVQEWPDPIPVLDGQVIEFEVDDDSEVEVEQEDVLEIEAPGLTLRVTATDASGNTAVAEAQPLGLSLDNDDASDLDD